MSTVPESASTVKFDAALAPLSATTLAALTVVRDKALAAYPTEHQRIHRGFTLAAMGAVDLHGDGTGSVYSQALNVWYHVAPGKRCPCNDNSRAPERRCKHVWARCMTQKAYTQVAMQTEEPLDHLPAPYTFPRWTKYVATYQGARREWYNANGIAIRCNVGRFTFIPNGHTNGWDVEYAEVALGPGLDD